MKSIKLIALIAATILSVPLFAQDSSMHKNKSQKTKMEKAKYSCPMHSDVTSNKPGKCSKCGMDLTLAPKEKKKTMAMKTYTCSMHPEVSSDKPGKCPKCGMDLIEKKDDHSDHQH
jgi:hypothetical protein